MKDEFGGVIVSEFVGLKSKMQSMKEIDDKEHNIAKGVSIATEFNKDVLFYKKIIRHKMKRIHDKRYVLDNGIYTQLFSQKQCQKLKNNVQI